MLKHSQRFLLLLVAFLVQNARGEEMDPEQLKRWTKFYQREATEYDIFLGGRGGQKLQFHEVPVFRWAAPITQNEFNGVIFVWTHNGRPEVLGSIWSVANKQLQGQRNIAHTFHSLSLQPLLANRNEQALWYPDKPGLNLKAIPNAPVPARTVAQRRLQMRAMSRDFSASQESKRAKAEPLTLLPRPLYEYETKESTGALFTFLRDWDPEVMLLIESQETKDGPRWYFEPLRFCMLSARVLHKDREVWSYKRGGPMRDPQHHYFSLHGATWVDRIIGNDDDS
jgi:hypothetical protein